MKTIFKTLVGSQVYGTATPESDKDFKGVYLQNPMDILGYDYKPQIEYNKDHTEYELRRFLELAESANPTILELLFMPNKFIEVITPEFEFIREYRHLFLTKKCKHSFGGYAIAQIKKANGLNKKGNWEKDRIERKDVQDFCYLSIGNGRSENLKEFLSIQRNMFKDCTIGAVNIDHMPQSYALYVSYNPEIILRGIDQDGKSNSIRTSSIPKNAIQHKVYYIGLFHFNLNAYQIHCKEFKNYQTWLNERNTARYVDFEKHGQLIDGKNMLHCVRLLDVATEIATQGELIIERPNAEYLLKIRRGEVNLQEILETCENKIKTLDDLYSNCTLPNDVDSQLTNNLLRVIRTNQLEQYSKFHIIK